MDQAKWAAPPWSNFWVRDAGISLSVNKHEKLFGAVGVSLGRSATWSISLASTPLARLSFCQPFLVTTALQKRPHYDDIGSWVSDLLHQHPLDYFWLLFLRNTRTICLTCIEAEDWKSACVSGYHIMGSVLNWLRRDFIACCSSGRTFFCFSPRFFLFFFILGMTLSSQLSLYDKGINPFFQLDRVMWFEGWSEGWQQTWTTEFWDWIEKKRSRLSSWHCGTWTISAPGF